MKNRSLIIAFVLSVVLMFVSVTGYFMTRSDSSTKNPVGTLPPNAVKSIVADAVPTPAPISTPAPVATKKYTNAAFGFSLQLPKDYWYEEQTEDWGVGPVFSLDVQHPGLKPASESHPNGTTTMTKYGNLMFVNICDRSLNRGKCLVDGKIDGMAFDRQSASELGGRSAQKFDDKAYVVVTDKYEYEIVLNPSLSGSLTTDEMKAMKQSFEDVVKTILFE